jgi:PAS domain S-box-containing protein
MHVRPTYDENGDLVAIEGLARDVTVRQRLEEQIRASEQQFRRLFEGFPHGLAFSGDDWRFTRVNPAMARILGYARDELIGRTGIELTHPDDVAGNIEQIQRLGPGGAPSIHLDKRYLRKDGAIVRAHTTILPVFGDGGDFLYALVVVVDVTEQKAVEAELARARERELARRVEEARLEGVFLTVRESAHKLGNALSHASGYGELALLHPDLSPDVRDLLHDSREGLEEAIRYLATLQRVARVEVKETPVGPALDVERSSRPTD